MTQDIDYAAAVAPGSELYIVETIRIGSKIGPHRVYYYRHYNGELFSAVGATLDAPIEKCRAERDAWIVSNGYPSRRACKRSIAMARTNGEHSAEYLELRRRWRELRQGQSA
jgi:hypothetical protein